MTDPTSSSISSIPSPVLLNRYTLCVIAITAILAIWGPKVASVVPDRAYKAVTSKTNFEADSSKAGGENKSKDAAPDHAHETVASQTDPETSLSKTEGESKEKGDEKPVETKKRWKYKNQIWSWGWEDVARPIASEDDDANMVFVAINRTWGQYSDVRDDHLWIEVNSPPLAELLRFEFRHVEGLVSDKPGIDARELYAGRERLAELAALAPLEEPARDNELERNENKDKTTTNGQKLDNKSDEDQGLKATKTESIARVSNGKAGLETEKGGSEIDKAKIDDRLQPSRRDTLTVPTGPDLSEEDYKQALCELNLLHNFMIDEFAKIENRLEKLQADGLISWRLLWTMFRHGERIETVHSTSGEKICFIMESWYYTTDNNGKMVFEVRGRWLEWTGFQYAEQRITRQIPEFLGLKKSAQLPVRHLSDEMFEALMARGRIYKKYAGVHHLNYSSAIIQMTDTGVSKTRAEGRLMVDVASYRRINPNSDRDDPRNYSAARGQKNGATPATWRTTLDDDDEDLALLPPTTHGWSFVAKLWGEVLVEDLSPVPFQPHVFNHLVLRDDYKSLIRSLVDAHAGRGESAVLTDVVTGKGGGLVIVLHGKPGTGKTLTAEAVSEHLERPLYIVSSGELGGNAAELEIKLRDTLDVATIWKAVLLIDEADVFLEARSSHELTRNALVSVFLRVLEYHSGVLILTTNRIRSFDDAFLSRFSVALRYPDLDIESRKLLWTKFLLLAGVTVEGVKSTSSPKAITANTADVNIKGGVTPHHFSLMDIDNLSSRNLNGRVIKQSVRTAQALAVSAGERLSMSHIETVLKISDKFAEDLKEVGY